MLILVDLGDLFLTPKIVKNRPFHPRCPQEGPGRLQGTILGRFGVDFGAIWGSIWGPFLVFGGDFWVFCGASEETLRNLKKSLDILRNLKKYQKILRNLKKS